MIEQDILAKKRLGLSGKAIARELGVSECVVRKVLIGAGYIDTPRTRRVAELRRAGMPQEDIAELLHISVTCVGANLPYERGSYLNGNKSVNAMRIKKCRAKKAAREGGDTDAKD